MFKSVMYLFLFVLVVVNNNLMAQNEKTSTEIHKLIYFGDPMCSWCYGFAPEIEAIHQKFDQIPMEIVLGGLRPNGKQSMEELKDFLKEHWVEIEHETGQKFSYDILDVDGFIYDTEPASRAVEVARTMKPDIALPFFKAVQTAFYFENKSTHDINTYLKIAEKFNLNQQKFEELFYSKAIIESTSNNFAQSVESGVRGFPTLVLQKGDSFHLVTNGYQKATALIPALEELLQKE